MSRFSRILVLLAAVCVIIALLIKITTVGRVLPGPLPLNWAKLADTLLLFSIALALLAKK